jgi:asparagine synthase (glutamine-hydrolysing)
MIDRPGNRICCLSWRPDRQPDPAALDAFFAGWTWRQGPGWLLASERAGCLAEAEATLVACGIAQLFDRARARLTTAAELGGGQLPGALGDLASPATVAWRDNDELNLATDALGIGQAFWHCGEGVAAASTSATLIADLFGLPPDGEALTGFALTGSFIADRAPFRDVRKVMAGQRARLRSGSLVVEPWLEAVAPQASATLDDLVEAFRGAVEAMIAMRPDIELSGGLDSRLILAAVPPARRRELRSLTIGAPGDEDVRIARRIAEANAMENVRVDPTDLGALSGDRLGALLAQVAQGYDHAVNPIDKLPLVLAGQRLKSVARLGGQNGEILRGFYYVGQPLFDAPGERLARNLIRWRLRANDQVDPALLATEAFADREAAVEGALVARLMEMGGLWGDTLDRYYLAERMQRWVGASTNNRFIDRTNLYPFFDPGVLAAAMALPVEVKRGGGIARALLARLDRELASMPLEGGRGNALDERDWLAPLLKGVRLAHKAGQRLRRQIGGRSRSTLGSTGIVGRWRDGALYRSLPFEGLAQSGLIAPRALERIGDGGWTPDRASLGFVLLVSSIVERPRCAAPF